MVTNLTTSAILYNNQLGYDESSSGAIAVNHGVARSVTFALPNGSAGVGTLGIGVLADAYGDSVYEYNAAGTAQSNNTNLLTINSTLAAYPDLAVTNISAPASVAAGSSFMATWVDVNRGSVAATNTWTENVLLLAGRFDEYEPVDSVVRSNQTSRARSIDHEHQLHSIAQFCFRQPVGRRANRCSQ